MIAALRKLRRSAQCLKWPSGAVILISLARTFRKKVPAPNADALPLSMISWLNLKPGSRNLASRESDGSGFHGGDPDKE